MINTEQFRKNAIYIQNSKWRAVREETLQKIFRFSGDIRFLGGQYTERPRQIHPTKPFLGN